jgi:hypothetical protein
MQKALYYPHSTLNDRALMKSSLLLWDQVEYIAPNREYKPRYDDSELAEAGELLMRPYIPSDEDRKSVSQAVQSMLDKAPQQWLLEGRSTRTADSDLYHLYRDKLSDDLIRELARRNLGIFPSDDPHDFSTHTSLGLILMGVLARRCAGTQKDMITDRMAQYEAVAKYVMFQADGTWLEPESAIKKRQEIETVLVTTSLKVIDPRGIGFKEILDLRKRETQYEGSFRQSYQRA